MRTIRAFFDNRGFIEVETPVRIPAPAPEVHIDCPEVKGGGFLRASPEIEMKKLLAAGYDLIYQIGPCFREGEKGERHNPEFTMIEWYRREADYLDIKRDLTELMRELFGCRDFEVKTLTVREAYITYAGWDPWENFDADRFDFDMATKIEPAIAEIGGGVFLIDYPKEASSLARLRGEVAERWEFYFNGLELANCFSELCETREQSKRFGEARAQRVALGEADYPIDREFLELLPLIGRASGVALGVDRLVMILTESKNISAVRA